MTHFTQYFRRWTSDHKARHEVKATIDECITLIENTRVADDISADQIFAKEREERLICLDVTIEEARIQNETVDIDDSRHEIKVDEEGYDDGDESIEHIQKQLFVEEEINPRKSYRGYARDDLTRLKIRLTMAHNMVQQYEERRLEREKLHQQNKIKDSRNKLRKSRNSKNYDSYYS